MCFVSNILDIIWRTIAYNWYSVLINGKSYDFLFSTREVKQGNPLSPALSLLIGEMLLKAMN